MKIFRLPLLAACLLLANPGGASADERMNGMVGLYYNTLKDAGFEYDLIAQFKKSVEWNGNITGPFVGDEFMLRGNKIGAGMVVGKREAGKGTYAASITVFEESRWGDLLTFKPGGEIKIALLVFGVKLGLRDWKERYLEIGLSY